MLCIRCHREYGEGLTQCPDDGGPLSSEPAIELLAERCKFRESDEIGKIYGERYVVRGFVGQGGMARVYLAQDTKTGVPVALKVLDRQLGLAPDAHERFFREATAASKIAHPSIVRIFDAGRHPDGSAFLVLEFLFGESLGELLRRRSVLAPKHALAVFDHAAAGLEAAHRAGIIHRDVKPDNIFLVGAIGAPHAVRVLDFGLAKIVAGTPLTALGVAVGTVEYMAPEQVLTEPPDARTDVYGLGVVMYRTFTGSLPFDSKDDALLLGHHLITPAPPPESRAPDLDRRICAVIARALRKHPLNRYASMDALREDIEKIVTTAPPKTPKRARLVRDPDVYEPTATFGRSAARFFYKKLGIKPPDWRD